MTEKYKNYTNAELIELFEEQIEDRKTRLVNGLKWHLANSDDRCKDDLLYRIISVLGDAIVNGIAFEDKGRYLTSQFDSDIHSNLPFIKEQVDTIKGLTELIGLLR